MWACLDVKVVKVFTSKRAHGYGKGMESSCRIEGVFECVDWLEKMLTCDCFDFSSNDVVITGCGHSLM